MTSIKLKRIRKNKTNKQTQNILLKIFSPADDLVSCLKKTILTFTLKFTLKEL